MSVYPPPSGVGIPRHYERRDTRITEGIPCNGIRYRYTVSYWHRRCRFVSWYTVPGRWDRIRCYLRAANLLRRFTTVTRYRIPVPTVRVYDTVTRYRIPVPSVRVSDTP